MLESLPPLASFALFSRWHHERLGEQACWRRQRDDRPVTSCTRLPRRASSRAFGVFTGTSYLRRWVLVLVVQLGLLAVSLFVNAQPTLPNKWAVPFCVVMLFPIPMVGYYYVLHRSGLALQMPRLLRTLILCMLSGALTLAGLVLGTIVFFFMGLPLDFRMHGV